MCPHVSEQVEKWKQTLTGGKNEKKYAKLWGKLENAEKWLKIAWDAKVTRFPQGYTEKVPTISVEARKSEVYSMEQRKGKKTAPRRSRTTCDMHADRRDSFFFFFFFFFFERYFISS